MIFYFQAADMATQILNFGLPAQIDVRTVGRDRANNLRVAKELRRRIAAIPGVVDAHLQQEVDAPAFMANIDRSRAPSSGSTRRPIATNLNVSLSSSEQVTPNFWTDPTIGNSLLFRRPNAGAPDYFAQRSRQYAGLHIARFGPDGHADTGAARAMWRRSSATSVPTNAEPDQYPAGL